jgi:hypothetical protein
MDIVSRVKGILLTPKTEWSVIAGETATVGTLYNGYIMPLAAIGPVALLVSFTIAGIFGSGILVAVVQYVLNLVAIYVLALIVSKLAPPFGGRDDLIQALKLAAYASTAVWVAAAIRIIVFIPGIWLIASLVMLAAAIYTIYLFYAGASPVLGIPDNKAAVFTLVAIVVTIVVYIVLVFLTRLIIGGGMMMM